MRINCGGRNLERSDRKRGSYKEEDENTSMQCQFVIVSSCFKNFKSNMALNTSVF